jgi:Acetyltransferase (GNAT) domain
MPDLWQERTEELSFQLGPWSLGAWKFSSLSNATSPLLDQGEIVKFPIYRPVTFQQLRDDGSITQRLSIGNGAIRYIPYRGIRYFVDLSSNSFETYLSKFSAKTRNTFKRKVRRFAKASGGHIDVKCYTAPDEMPEFCQHAAAISRLSYQDKLGFGFPHTKEFRERLTKEAVENLVKGYVLFLHSRPVSYVFCRVNSDTVIYSIPGYDPEFAGLSPGAVLLYTMLERLFADPRVKVFDFGGHAWDYKALFATGGVSYLKVVWLPLSAKNFTFVIMHLFVRQAWETAAWGKGIFRGLLKGASGRPIPT